MGQIDRGTRGRAYRAAATAIALICAAALTPTTFAAPAKPNPAAAPQDAAAQKAQQAAAGKSGYEAGVKSYAAGKYEPAVTQLSEALRVGGLPSTDMAHALFLRGLSYKKQNRPGLAISDLTSALWLKNGLAEADRQTAMNERAEAYRQAGLGDGSSVAGAYAATDPGASRKEAAPAAPAAAPAAAAKSTVAAVAPEASSPNTSLIDPAAPTVTRLDQTSEKAIEAAEARRLAARPVEDSNSFVSTSVGGSASAPAPVATIASSSVSTTATVPADAPSLSALPADTSSGSSDSTSSGVSNFFSNLFGGGSSAPAPVQAAAEPPPQTINAAPVTTASTTPVDAPAAGGAATSAWQQTAAGAEAGAAPVKAAAKTETKPQKQAAAATTAPKGKYKLHIAATRSREEAEAVAAKLTQAHVAELASRTPTVDEAVIGSMGTFYRVRVGGYANPDEPRGVCNKLRTSGFDCLVVTN